MTRLILTLVITIFAVLYTQSQPQYTEQGPPVPQATEPSRGSERVQTLTMEATAYCHTGSMTYTETWPVAGRTIAVDPEVIPLGSHVWVEGFGWMIAEDTGGAIKGNIIDIYMDTREEALQWGRRDVLVIIPEQP
ncbi:3D domain-containing protein [Peptococcaceae bacterium 1198_IL3148]